ncbi:MAG: alpha/beta hydrolase [Alphaproteobacteria bacterium]|jgi:fermentation-respiration switch protein FrsA (DUF1100 family)|nr:alpha/beta hydrolase [Alphaproteobacteria bacterium]
MITKTLKYLGIAATFSSSIATTTLSAEKLSPDNFYKSDLLTVREVSFKNQYNMKMVGNLYIPKNIKAGQKLSAIVIGHPMGAVKEQSANLYAQKMAEKGFITLSVDTAFWGGSEGNPRNAVSVDIYVETFNAAVDFLGTLSQVNKNNIGAIGICGSGGFVIAAAKIDPRIKAIATVSMYDMGDVSRHGLNNSLTLEQRNQIIAEATAQREIEFSGGATKYSIVGTPSTVDENSDPIAQEFYAFYRTPRGQFIPKGATLETTTHPTLSSVVKFMNFYPFNDIETISPRPILFIAGENAHSIEFSLKAYKLAGASKELYIVKNAGHVDLYDDLRFIPFDKLGEFFKKHLS